MLLWIIKNTTLASCYHFTLDFFNSIFFRGICSFFLSFFVALIVGSFLIKKLCNFRIFQIIRFSGPKSHVAKDGTPTMGGLIMLISVMISVIICADYSNIYIWYVLFILIMYGALGLIDDFLKIKRKNAVGLKALYKYVGQSLIACILIFKMFISSYGTISTQLVVPFFSNFSPQLGIWYVVLAYFVIVGTSNAVNLSDGLDGLAIVPIILITAGLTVVSWFTSDAIFSNGLHVVYFYLAKELIIVCVAMIGSGLGFLWFNTYPAQIFMGDVGSLSFGGAIGVIAVLLHQEFLLMIMGGIFVLETISVILQVVFFKIFKRRIFKMSPIHHHFELQGCPESKIVVRFWIISLILVLFGLVTLKI